MAEMDNTTEENMENLETVGLDLLLQNVKRMNVNTFVPFELHQTNAEALDRSVQLLSQIKVELTSENMNYVCVRCESKYESKSLVR